MNTFLVQVNVHVLGLSPGTQVEIEDTPLVRDLVRSQLLSILLPVS